MQATYNSSPGRQGFGSPSTQCTRALLNQTRKSTKGQSKRNAAKCARRQSARARAYSRRRERAHIGMKSIGRIRTRRNGERKKEGLSARRRKGTRKIHAWSAAAPACRAAQGQGERGKEGGRETTRRRVRR